MVTKSFTNPGVLGVIKDEHDEVKGLFSKGPVQGVRQRFRPRQKPGQDASGRDNDKLAGSYQA
jgi:hypothetical protein